jgi:hypothetical protein
MRRALLASLAACLVLLLCPLADADVIFLEDGGKHRGTITKETRRAVTIETGAGPVVIPRGNINKIVREVDPRSEFLKRYKKVRKSGDADALYALGAWAKTQKLEKEALRCFKRALRADAYHEKARQALGHRLYQGRWYSKADYEKVSSGLVKFEDRWVTPEEKEKLDLGLRRDPNGKWINPNAKRAAPPPAAGRAPAPKPWRPKPPKKAGAPKSEDTAWYYDNTRSGNFADAPTTESRFYKIKTNTKAEFAKRYGKMMDRYYKKFLVVFRDFLPRGDLPKGTIYIYASRQEFRQSTGSGPNTGGFYQTGIRRVTAFHGPFGNTGNTRDVLAHEGTHQFEDFVLGGRGFGNCPQWILEGLAVLFESAVYDGKEVVVGLVPRDRLMTLKRGLASGSLIPLDRLIRTRQSGFTAYHYAHAWSLIYMILYSSESKSVRKNTQKWFASLFTASREGPVTADSVIERCGGPDKFAELEQRWKDFIRDLPYDYDPR